MAERIRMPGDLLNVKTRFFGRFTAKDLVRLGAPVLVAGAVSPAGPSPTLVLHLCLGAVAGVAWYGWRPYSRTIGTHLRNLTGWLVSELFAPESIEISETRTAVIREDGTAVALLSVTPTNLEMKTDAEQRALHNRYQKLLSTVTYPVTVHTRQRHIDLNDYADQIHDSNKEPESIRENYAEYCRSLSDDDIVTTDHIIQVTAHPNSLNWLYTTLNQYLTTEDDNSEQDAVLSELDSRCRELTDALDTSELDVHRITGPTLEKTASNATITDPRTSVKHYRRTEHDDYRRTVQLSELPANVELAWPLQLLRIDGLVDTTQVIEPRDPGTTSKKLRRVVERTEAEIDSFLRQGYRGTNKLEALLDDAEWFLDLLTDREDQPVGYTAYVTVRGSTRKECDQAFDKLVTRLQTMQFGFTEPVFQTDHSLRTTSPLYPDRLNQPQLVPARSAAAGFPFGTQTTEQQNGVVHGVETRDETPVLLDRFSWSSHSMARMGMVGSGKSYATKLEILRAYFAYPDLRIIVVDPKQEYGALIRRLNGTVHTLTSDDSEYSFDDRVVGVELPERGFENSVEVLREAVRDIYTATSQNQEKTLVLVDEARILLNDEEGRQVLNQFVLKGRDTNTAITLVTQNASHFTYCREGREILDNMPGTVFMRHDRVPDSVVDYFDLSQQEKQELFELKTGTDTDYSEALVKVSGRINTRLKVESTPAEHAIIQAGERGDNT